MTDTSHEQLSGPQEQVAFQHDAHLVPPGTQIGHGGKLEEARELFLKAWDTLKKYLKEHPGLVWMVIVPNIIYGIYLFGIASPQYISETHYMVRGARLSAGLGTPLGIMMQTGEGGVTSENTFAVQDYMISRDAMNLLMKRENLAKVYNRAGADFMARYPNWHSHENDVTLYKYYKGHVISKIDSETMLNVLKVRTFNPADSQRLANALLKGGEELVNRMNARQRATMIGAAQQEVTETLRQLAQLRVELTAFRGKTGLIDPEKQTMPLVGTAYALQAMLTSTRMRLEEVQRTAPDSPAIRVYRQQIATLKKELATANSHLTGAQAALVPELSEYDVLLLKRQILEKTLLAETTALESAKEQARRQMVFLEVVSAPNYPAYPEYPPALTYQLVFFACTYSLYIMARLMVAGAREHKIT
ncbi:capsule biosynthesis protein [Oecophyllibacter saccharovorans]|uniref:capsule biosynthesis protein n=1 Tax=Oecophyllibacter saccharovorans TaxID=2558360 RepID=UPI0011420E43|nr:capsule biosynthesis protein [Oecophyllibacter saccharovorans]QDH15505.1 capsule biosynthesis protein [Oecophyllibacter saccharovorans]